MMLTLSRTTDAKLGNTTLEITKLCQTPVYGDMNTDEISRAARYGMIIFHDDNPATSVLTTAGDDDDNNEKAGDLRGDDVQRRR
jgi:hypothetical protein